MIIVPIGFMATFSPYDELVMDIAQAAEYLQCRGYDKQVVKELRACRPAVEKFVEEGSKKRVKDLAELCRDAIAEKPDSPVELYHVMSYFAAQADLDNKEVIRLLFDGLVHHVNSPVLFCELGTAYFRETLQAMKKNDRQSLIACGDQALYFLRTSISLDAQYKACEVFGMVGVITQMVEQAQMPKEGNA